MGPYKTIAFTDPLHPWARIKVRVYRDRITFDETGDETGTGGFPPEVLEAVERARESLPGPAQ